MLSVSGGTVGTGPGDKVIYDTVYTCTILTLLCSDASTTVKCGVIIISITTHVQM